MSTSNLEEAWKSATAAERAKVVDDYLRSVPVKHYRMWADLTSDRTWNNHLSKLMVHLERGQGIDATDMLARLHGFISNTSIREGRKISSGKGASYDVEQDLDKRKKAADAEQSELKAQLLRRQLEAQNNEWVQRDELRGYFTQLFASFKHLKNLMGKRFGKACEKLLTDHVEDLRGELLKRIDAEQPAKVDVD